MGNKLREKRDVKSLGKQIVFVDSSEAAKNAQNETAIQFFNDRWHQTPNENFACLKTHQFNANDGRVIKSNYFIRIHNTGERFKRPYHPVRYPETDMNRTTSDTEQLYLWKKVCLKHYNLYGKFLMTRNEIYLTQLEAELSDAT